MSRISIPIPKKIPGTRKGIYSTGHFKATDNKVRLSPVDAETVNKAASICNLSKSAFMRWVAVYAAYEIIKLDVAKRHQVTEIPNKEPLF